MSTPLVCWNTPCTPQKQPPAKTAVAVAAVAFCVSVWAQGTDYSKIEILTDKIAPNLYLLSGSAGVDPAHEDALIHLAFLVEEQGQSETADLLRNRLRRVAATTGRSYRKSSIAGTRSACTASATRSSSQ